MALVVVAVVVVPNTVATNRVCKIIGTDILLLYEAILHLVSLTSIQTLSLEVVFAYPF